MPPKPKSAPISSHPFPSPANPIPRKSTPIITKTPIVSGPTVILPPKIPNTEPVVQPKQIIIPTATTSYSNTPAITSSNLPNTTPETTKNQDNTLTYVILGALVVGFIILQNKDI